MNTRITILAFAVLATASQCFAIDEFEQAPINYSKATPENVVSRLQAKLDAGEAKLRYDADVGYVRSVLEALEVPVSSQTLVFSKTSLQRQRISPQAPRSLFFNDDVYVGFCQAGEVMEVSAVDPQLGTVFYVVEQQESDAPRFIRQLDNCLICHASSHTGNVPGHTIRSVYSDRQGLPLLASGSFRIDHTSPLKNRWGGWYVTGTHGSQQHLGNMIFAGRVPNDVENTTGVNVTSLADRVDLSSGFLSQHSDIVALMVLEHQAEAHNRLTFANYQTRLATHHEAELNRAFGEASDHRWPSTESRIKAACEPLVKYLLMCEEAPLAGTLRGTTEFAAEFAARGPRDLQGRSLRDLDLQRRLFRYPLSYLVYSAAFDGLPAEAKRYVYRRFDEVLSGRDDSREFAHLTIADRRAVREILHETMPDFATAVE